MIKKKKKRKLYSVKINLKKILQNISEVLVRYWYQYNIIFSFL